MTTRFITKGTGKARRVIPISKSKPVPVQRRRYQFPTRRDFQAIQQEIEARYPHFPLSKKEIDEINRKQKQVRLYGTQKIYPMLNPYARAYHRVSMKHNFLKSLKKYHKVKHTLNPIQDALAKASLKVNEQFIRSLDSRQVMLM
ncbi:hypothetical protein GQ472_00635 [archaeon]|nr:hypothetical protein [archaeon]